jgi:exodeoxyribonuclease VII large subunit
VSTGGDTTYTVSELQREVRILLEDQYRAVWVEGEISGLRATKHAYFTLKDDHAQLSSVMWASTMNRAKVAPENGLAVRARGHLTIYEQGGRYQFIVQRLEPLGAGPLQARFEKLKARLAEEGLFDADRKQALPRFPRRAALVTSPTGAAVRDLVHVAQRRWPALGLVVLPVRVQGEGAAEEIAEGIRLADTLGVDVIVTGRGGGSLEDLWAFNEEAVARAIAAARTPVVSAVGHEIDWSIADFVADQRAATPSAAAESITPDRAELREVLRGRGRRLAHALTNRLLSARARLAAVEASRPFKRPLDFVRDREQAVDALLERLADAGEERVADLTGRLAALGGKLDALSPLKVLGRGYSVTLSGDAVVRSPGDVRAGDELRTILRDGEVKSRVIES